MKRSEKLDIILRYPYDRKDDNKEYSCTVSSYMSEKYKVLDNDLPYYVTFATEAWVDVFTKQAYREIIWTL